MENINCSPATSSNVAATTSPTSASDYAANDLFIELEQADHKNFEISMPTQSVLNSIEFLNNLKQEFHKDSCTKEQKFK